MMGSENVTIMQPFYRDVPTNNLTLVLLNLKNYFGIEMIVFKFSFSLIISIIIIYSQFESNRQQNWYIVIN